MLINFMQFHKQICKVVGMPTIIMEKRMSEYVMTCFTRSFLQPVNLALAQVQPFKETYFNV